MKRKHSVAEIAAVRFCLWPIRVTVVLLLCSQTRGLFVEDQYPSDDGDPIRWNKLVIDNRTGIVYAGAVNQLYQFDANLTLFKAVKTGPMLDDSSCYFGLGLNASLCQDLNGRNVTSVLTDNYNQVLVVDERHGQLVTCGTVYHGSCQNRSLGNISIFNDFTDQYSQFVAVNSPKYPTVAFVAPGPFDDDVLYVGSVFTSQGKSEWYLEKYLGGVSSRNLTGSRIFTVTDNDPSLSIQYGTRAFLYFDAAVNYKVTYVAGFSSGGYSYFVTQQLVPYLDPNAVVRSKFVQVCQSDKYFDSYAEMVVMCKSNGVEYNLIQATALVNPGSVLSKALGIDSTESIVVGAFTNSLQAPSTAICIYRLSDVRRAFTQNIQHCFDTPSDYVGQQFDESKFRKCSFIPNNISDSYCGTPITNSQPRRNSPLVGNITLNASTNIVFPWNVTSLTATTVGNQTVLFIGSADGRLIKAAINSAMDARIYENSVISSTDNSAVNQDMQLSPDKEHLYVMTAKKIYKIPVSDCSHYVTCNACLTSLDPYCGWCTLQNSCTRPTSCLFPGFSKRWIPTYPETTSPASFCPALLGVSPRQSDVNNDEIVRVSISSLPIPSDKNNSYLCVFGKSSVAKETVAYYTPDSLDCKTGSIKPMIPRGSDSVVVNLSITTRSTHDVNFIQTNFTFYNCSILTSCSSCTSARWSCHWCTLENSCTNRMQSCGSLLDVLDPQLCPQLKPMNNVEKIQSGSSREIVIRGSNLPSLPQVSFSCRLPDDKLISATRVSDNVTCSNYTYISYASQPAVSFITVVWKNTGGWYSIDGSYNFTVFNCSAMASDCSTCIGLQQDPATAVYGCQWCGMACQPSCSGRTQTTTCPRATITSIQPLSGPKQGGTLLTITGNDLGYSFQSVIVSIGGLQCRGVRERYIVSKQFFCLTPRAGLAGSSAVSISVPNGMDTSLNQISFIYTDPEVYSIIPTFGPIAGGTAVTIYGKDLMADSDGHNISVVLGSACPVVRSRCNNSQIVFVTEPSSSVQVGPGILVIIDDAHLATDLPYRYVANPTVRSIMPGGSFKSGGCRITLSGSNFNSSESVLMKISSGNVPSVATIQPFYKDAQQIQFLSPDLNSEFPAGTYNLTITQDGSINYLEFNILEDPFVETFPDEKMLFSPSLILKGQRLMTSCMDNYQSTVQVKIGATYLCNVTYLSDTSIYCTLPNNLAAESNTKLTVNVVVGNLNFYLGELIGETPTSSAWQIGVGVGVGLGASFIIVIILAVLIYVKMSRRRREYKKLLLRIVTLEKSVGSECKQAFAELQTHVSGFTNDISVNGIPFWDFQSYAFKLLFPMINDHPVLHIAHDANSYFGTFSNERMHHFNQLLSSKYFLLTFIRTLDQQQREFSIEDKSKVASWLIIVLLNRLDYATDIIKELLEELIERSLEKKAPKLMLRRTESIVEKLLANWLSLSMYEYMTTHAGQALFILCKAIKYQLEDGPLDACTLESKYSLSETRLLREKIEAKTLNVTVFGGERGYEGPVSCKMLDCDTITQAKEKALDAIYKNMPYSGRPQSFNIELMLHTGHGIQSSRLPLKDEDSTTKTISGWKQINTLHHYHIPSTGAIFSLVHLQNNEEYIRHIHGQLHLDCGALLSSIKLEETGTGSKVYHLVKPEDNQNVNGSDKVISEIFLTRLLTTKKALEEYVRDLFQTILRVDNSMLPPTIKYLFDFLDNAAKKHEINDPDVVHAWKSNSLPLRFWVNMITNPHFIFDIGKSSSVDSCLAVIAQIFMDSCSTHEHRLGIDSPSAKLLFAKEISDYRRLVGQFYRGVQGLPPVSDKAIAEFMGNYLVSAQDNSAKFNVEVALQELYMYAYKFHDELCFALDSDPSAKKFFLAAKFKQLDSRDSRV